MQTYYNKLIRDNIPDVIKAQGQIPVTRTLDDNEYLSALNRKLREEVLKYSEDNCLEELSDVLEVAFAIAKAKGYSDKEIEGCRNTKNLKNGAFDKKLFLERVISDDEKAKMLVNDLQFVIEEVPSSDAVDQLVSMVRAYEGEYFTDFSDGVRIDAPFQWLCYLKSSDEMFSAIMFTCLDGHPHITVMATRRDAKNKGYGKQLMNCFVEYVSRLGFHDIELYAWSEKTKPICASTQAFYKSVGFKVESEHMSLWAPGMITVKMKKSW